MKDQKADQMTQSDGDDEDDRDDSDEDGGGKGDEASTTGPLETTAVEPSDMPVDEGKTDDATSGND